MFYGLTNYETMMNIHWNDNISVFCELTLEISEIQTDLNYTAAQNYENNLCNASYSPQEIVKDSYWVPDPKIFLS